jgi:two-component system sensor histidine kinase NblS
MEITNKLNNKEIDLLIENIFDGVILLNLDLKIIFINYEALKIFDWELLTVSKTNFLLYFDLQFKFCFLKKIKKLFERKNQIDGKNFLTIIVNYKKVPNKILILKGKILIKEEQIFGILLNITDITKELKLNKKKANFLSNISHELRTPLFNIHSFIQTLDNYSSKLDEKEIKEFLNITNQEILRLNRLVNNILDFSKFNSKTLYLFSPISINEIFNQVIQVYRITVKQKKIKFRTEIEKNLPYILGKKDLLFQVFDNLIGNALKFSNPKSIILFRAYTISNNNINKVRIEIVDTGIGISTNIQKNIFRRFSKINMNKKKYGTGLGLSIVKKILQKHSAQIYLSTEEKEGTIFFIDFLIGDF